jgi:hypothetical protein
MTACGTLVGPNGVSGLDTGLVDRRQHPGVGFVMVAAGPVVSVALGLSGLAFLNWLWPRIGDPTTQSAFWASLPMALLVAVALVAGTWVTSRGLASLGVDPGWSRLLLAAGIVVAGAALLAVLGWLARVSIQSGSSS